MEPISIMISAVMAILWICFMLVVADKLHHLLAEDRRQTALLEQIARQAVPPAEAGTEKRRPAGYDSLPGEKRAGGFGWFLLITVVMIAIVIITAKLATH